MKAKLYIVLLIWCLVGISCKDYLNESPKTFLTPSNFYTTESDLKMGLNSIYAMPQERYSNMWGAPNWFGWGTDCGQLTPANGWPLHNQIASLRTDFNSSSEIPWYFWDYVYRGVKNANYLIQAIPNVQMDETNKKIIEAQARAFRALFYFDGVRIFGALPLILKPTSDPDALNALTRTPVEEIYNQIIADLKLGAQVLPNKWSSSEDQGRITSGACVALLARVYVTMAGSPLKKTAMWTEAKTILKELVEDKKYGTQYELFTNYSDAFADSNIPGKESVWTVNFTKGTFGQASDVHTNFAPLELYYDSRGGLSRGGGWSNELPTDAFYNSYDKIKDTRFKFTFWTSTADFPDEYADINSSTTGPIVFEKPHIKKFREKTPNDNSQGTGIDHYIIRYADVLLMYAETLNELNDNNSYKYLNMIRNRAGLADFPVKSQSEFRDQILLERAWELCYEGERRFELTRAGKYYELVKKWNTQAGSNVVQGKHELWPIPQREIDINKNITQNPNY